LSISIASVVAAFPDGPSCGQVKFMRTGSRVTDAVDLLAGVLNHSISSFYTLANQSKRIVRKHLALI